MAYPDLNFHSNYQLDFQLIWLEFNSCHMTVTTLPFYIQLLQLPQLVKHIYYSKYNKGQQWQGFGSGFETGLEMVMAQKKLFHIIEAGLEPANPGSEVRCLIH